MQADNSGGGQVWVPEGAWGDLGGSLIHLSYGQSTAYTVLKDEVNGQVQGGVIALPFKLMSSAMRARFNPANNNQLYITGFKGWQTNATLLSAINRITYKGQPFKRVSKLKASTKGLYLTFNHTLDPTSANNLQNYSIQRWNYLYSKQYGSAHFATDIPEKELEKYRNTESKSVGRVGIPSNRSGESVYITAVKLLPDNKTVFLKIQDMKPVDQMKIDYSLLTSKGQELSQTIYNTIYNLTADSIEVADMVSIDTLKEQEKRNAYDLGAKVEVIDEYGNQDTFKSRTLALQVKDTDSVSPFLQPGSFSATYTGYIQVAEKDRVTFQARGNGQLTFELNNKTLINFNGNQQKVTSKVTSLNSGFHAYTIRYRSGNSHPRFLILWNGNKFPLSPVSPLSLRFLSDGAIKKAQIMRDQRSFVAEKRCFNCHSTEIELNMPELQQDSPSLDNIGSRIKQAWMAKWIANPQTLRHQTNMPKLVNNNEAAHIAAYLATKVTSPLQKQCKVIKAINY
ncbi:PA14 domain-containing protein [Paraglaciecola aquimarina]|uniref:PA14 domain-containing protein n=1 Tax=Paraglaciecola aquimarina TaxID=1235557 RepID=A0ABU3SZE0_9ALTE|nr:PA14 domain-containing protein [Paraglaciecola aquimarina]MDU0355356.1 PA14 domain-containing protein [Paraglaciecola aquimarina]